MEMEFYNFTKDSGRDFVVKKMPNLTIIREIKNAGHSFFYPTFVINGIVVDVGEYSDGYGNFEIEYNGCFYTVGDSDLFKIQNLNAPLTLGQIYAILKKMVDTNYLYKELTTSVKHAPFM